MAWIKDTRGKPNSQLTISLAWNLVAMIFAGVIVARWAMLPAVANALPALPDGFLVFIAGMCGIGATAYVTRRKQDGPGLAPTVGPEPGLEPGGPDGLP